MKRFLALDGFRGICAMIVVVFHTHIVGSFSEWTFFRNGSLFVDFFFILSGFVLFHTYGQRLFNKADFKRFLISRTFRLFPLHLFMLCVFILFELGKYFAEKKGFSFNISSFSEVNDLSEIIPNLLLLQSWLPNANAFSFNYPSWSISVEYFVYIIFGFTLFLSSPIKKTTFFLIGILSFFAMTNGFPILKAEAIHGIFCFFSGCLCYILYLRIEKISLTKSVYNILEIISLLAVFLVLVSKFDHRQIVVIVLFMLVILIFSFEKGMISTILKSKVISYLGKLSYSIYLTHAAILFIVLSGAIILSKICGENFAPMLGRNGDVPIRHITSGNLLINNLLLLSILGIVVLISKLTYKYVELKGISLGKKITGSSPQIQDPLKTEQTSM